MRTRRPCPAPIAWSAFADFCFPPDVIVLAVRWYLRFGLSYRDVEELLAERGVEVDHVTVYRWVQRFTPLLAKAARRFFERAIGATKHAGRSRHRQSASVPASAPGAAAGGLASHRSVRQQPHRGRPRPSQVEAGSDARAQAGPQR
jgi:hypothetical protein